MGFFAELFQPAWKSKNQHKALAAVAQITDQTELMQIIKSAPVWSAREEALDKLADQTLLSEIVTPEKAFNSMKYIENVQKILYRFQQGMH